MRIETGCSKFDKIYADMLLQFPEEELKPYDFLNSLLKTGEYKLSEFYWDNVPVGYVLYLAKDFVWVDYLAVYCEFHSKGFGTKILQTLFDSCKELRGAYFEVEKADSKKPDTLRRLNFYDRLGCENTNFQYYFPNDIMTLKMELLYKPLRDCRPAKKQIISDIGYVFNRLHSNVACVKQVYEKICLENN